MNKPFATILHNISDYLVHNLLVTGNLFHKLILCVIINLDILA